MCVVQRRESQRGLQERWRRAACDAQVPGAHDGAWVSRRSFGTGYEGSRILGTPRACDGAVVDQIARQLGRRQGVIPRGGDDPRRQVHRVPCVPRASSCRGLGPMWPRDLQGLSDVSPGPAVPHVSAAHHFGHSWPLYGLNLGLFKGTRCADGMRICHLEHCVAQSQM